MKAVLKSMWLDSATINLDTYFPDESDNFGLSINFRVGPKDMDEADDYQVFVCTPEWLKTEGWKKTLWGRHMLIVFEYDLAVIRDAISQCVESCVGKDFGEVAQKIARFAAWEFEDYQS